MPSAGAFDSISDLPRSAYFASDGREGTFLEALVRYGNRVQSEKANVQQSLFGGGNAEADIQKPEPLPHEPWTKLEMLNKEREVIGIYLSSHPLDDFSVIIRHYCHSTLGDLQDLPSMKNKDFTVAGMVTSVHAPDHQNREALRSFYDRGLQQFARIRAL